MIFICEPLSLEDFPKVAITFPRKKTNTTTIITATITNAAITHPIAIHLMLSLLLLLPLEVLDVPSVSASTSTAKSGSVCNKTQNYWYRR